MASITRIETEDGTPVLDALEEEVTDALQLIRMLRNQTVREDRLSSQLLHTLYRALELHPDRP